MKNEGLKRTAATGLKILLLTLAVMTMYVSLTGGGPSATAFSEMENAVLSAADLGPMSRGNNQMLRRIYGLDPEALEGTTLYYPTSSMSVDELLLVKFSDEDREAVREAMEERVASQITSFEGYGPEQVATLERAVIEVEDNYALLISGPDPEGVRQAFLNAYGGARP